MKMGISTACFYPAYVEDAVQYLTEHQIENIEIFINSFSEMKKEYLQSLQKMLKNAGTQVLSIHPFTSGIEPMLFFNNYERRVADGIEFYKNYFSAANELSANILVLHGDRKMGTMEDERYFERYLRLMEVGKTFGVTVAQENVERCKSGDLRFLQKMKSALKDDVHFVLDLKQARREGIAPEMFLRELGDSICHIHVNDGNEAETCLPIGLGTMDFAGFFEELKQRDYQGGVILELYRKNYNEYSDLLDSYQKLKSFV